MAPDFFTTKDRLHSVRRGRAFMSHLSKWLVFMYSLSFTLADLYPCPTQCVCTGPFVNVNDTVHELNVTMSSITSIDSAKNVINCSRQGFSKFPPDINSAVQILDLSFNGIDNLPTPGTLASLNILEKLLLGENNIRSPISEKAFDGLRSMLLIDLSSNYLFSLPPKVFTSSKKLKTILLHGNKKLSRIPSIIVDSAKELDVSYCGINNVSFSILPKNLKNLIMWGNKLFTLPGDGPISSNTLENMDLRNCSISQVHREALSRLPKLTNLRLSKNRGLSSISTVRSDSLRTIEVNDCGLGSSEEEDAPLGAMPHLTRAYLAGNSLKSIGPQSFTNNPLLVELDLSRNELTKIGPGALYPLRNLQQLNLSYNKLTDLDQSVFSANEHLEKIDLSYNSPLDTLPSFTAYSLVKLEASHCGITELGDGDNPLSGMPNLQILDLCYNPLESLPVMASQALKILDLAFCRLVAIKTSSLEGLSQLDKLILVGNRISRLDPNLVKRLSYLAISDNPWKCACNDPNFLELWRLVERMEPSGQPLHCAPESKSMIKKEKAKEPGEGLKLWSDVCHRSAGNFPSKSTPAIMSTIVAVILTIAGVGVAVVVYRHWASRKRKEIERRNAAEAERRLQRLRRRERRSEDDEDEDGERRRRHRDIVTVRRRRDEPRVSEPPPYEEAVLMPRPAEVEVTLETSTVDHQDSLSNQAVIDGQFAPQRECSERQEAQQQELEVITEVSEVQHDTERETE